MKAGIVKGMVLASGTLVLWALRYLANKWFVHGLRLGEGALLLDSALVLVIVLVVLRSASCYGAGWSDVVLRGLRTPQYLVCGVLVAVPALVPHP